MKVDLERTFALPGPAEVAWTFLQDIEAVAGCMPGAKIVERLPDGRYKGTVSVRAGPATMAFRGELEVRDVDAATRSLRLVGKGTDTTGSSGASMTLDARIDAVDAGASKLVGRSEVTVSGKAAAFGGRMMSSVADQVLKQFAECFATRVKARAEQLVATPDASPPADAVPSPAAAGSSAPAPAAAAELNGLALLWAVIRDWLRGLFRGRPA